MSILIKGMDMPKGENITISWTTYQANSITVHQEKINKKDIIEIPTPHGRLIDGDELKQFEQNAWEWESVDGIATSSALKQVIHDIRTAPTIIEAEE